MSTTTPTTDAPDAPAPPDAPSPSRRRRAVLPGLVILAAAAVLPLVHVSVPVILPGALDTPGSLQILGIGLVYVGLAVSYDVVFGYTGLLSLGHALFFAFGVYGTNLLMIHAGWAFVPAAVGAMLVAGVSAVVLGGLALRVRGIAFAMVTLAYAEALSLFLLSDPLRITGGEEGLPLASAQVPAFLRGVVNAAHVYWLALGVAVLTYAVSALVVRSHAGRVWQAIRENEDRVELLGLVPFGYKLAAFTVGGTLAAAGGAVYLVLVHGANPSVSSADFTLALLIMVVLGGAGRLWGAALGGLVYALLTLRLNALGTSGVLDGLPDWLERTVSEPLFVLGTLFVLLVLFAPGGIAGVVARVRAATRGDTRRSS